ncbi:hypothetical protein BC939DRAFT_514588 [Gamsiella multidivaricata]|uniref:uncharacterized protein n=1 Tax=Gamsiella multidivaricata TaxID=101098 RepID=UPI002220C989|nr:uncharacterized protein BC939DRAFT_514588 [Gamsiella multidivaricata]KAI7826142.1 hypothetical protein BC939DRAFT_514588 [Gamsiella multidivaricata]
MLYEFMFVLLTQQVPLAKVQEKDVHGELASHATKWQRNILHSGMESDMGTLVYGRKVDLQCRVGNIELSNRWIAKVFCLKQLDGVFISNLVTNHAPRIPHDEATWRVFLKGHTVATLYNYVERLKKSKLVVEDRVIEARTSNDSTSQLF